MMNFQEKINDIDWVFFDFFDTIVHRKISENAVDEAWACEMSMKLKYKISANQLVNARRKSVIKAYQLLKMEEVPYKEIIRILYNLLHEKLSEYNFEEFFNISYKTELNVESKIQYADKECRKKIQDSLHAGKKIGIISDYYLGREALKFFLIELGYQVDIFSGIYVSSEYNAKKISGNLYDKVLLEIKCEATRCLMVGDNETADNKRAIERGFKVFPVPYENKLKENNYKKSIQIIAKKYEKLPFSNYAFGMYYFVEQLYQEAVKKEYATLTFLAREGFLLRKLFEIYQSNKDIKVKTEYIYVSRLASFLPSLSDIEIEQFDAILTQYGDISLEAFLKNLQFSDEIIEEISQELNFKKDKIIFDFKSSNEFMCLKNNKLFLNTYNKAREQASIALRGYINSILGEDSTIVLVDVGWKGTMQDNLYRAYEGKRKFVGLYYGIFSQTGLESNNNTKIGVVFNQFPERSKYYYIWEFETHLIEQLLVAPHGSTKGYKLNGKQFLPILDKTKEDERVYELAKNIQDNIINIVEQLTITMQYVACSQEFLFREITCIQLKTELLVNNQMILFEKNALSEKTNNFGWFSKIPSKTSKKEKIKSLLRDIKRIHKQEGDFSCMKYLGYFSIKMNAREKYQWKKIVYRLIYIIEKCRMI